MRCFHPSILLHLKHHHSMIRSYQRLSMNPVEGTMSHTFFPSSTQVEVKLGPGVITLPKVDVF